VRTGLTYLGPATGFLAVAVFIVPHIDEVYRSLKENMVAKESRSTDSYFVTSELSLCQFRCSGSDGPSNIISNGQFLWPARSCLVLRKYRFLILSKITTLIHSRRMLLLLWQLEPF
jgi:hypothetical protein